MTPSLCAARATLAQSGEHFPERTGMPRSSPQNQANSPQNDVSEPEETARRGTGAMPQALLSSPDSGMIVFSSSARILHMNGPARALMALFGTSHELWPQMAPESMPSILTEFCYDVLAQLQRRIEAQDWTQFEMRRICHMVTPSLRTRSHQWRNFVRVSPSAVVAAFALTPRRHHVIRTS